METRGRKKAEQRRCDCARRETTPRRGMGADLCSASSKQKKGAAAEPPPNCHGRAFLRVVAGQPLPSFTVNSVYVVAEEAEDGAGKDNGGEEDGKGDDGEAKLPPCA